MERLVMAGFLVGALAVGVALLGWSAAEATRFALTFGIGVIVIGGVMTRRSVTHLVEDCARIAALEPSPEEVPAAAARVVERAGDHGCEPVGTFRYRYARSAQTVIIALAAAEGGVVVEVVHGVRVRRRRPGVGVHSELAGGRACLTTQATGSLPTGPREIRRVLPGADVEGLIRQHRADLAVLADRGLSPNPVRDAEDALRVHRMAYEQQEAALRAHPLRAAFTTFASRMTGWNLDTTPLWDRPDIDDRIAALTDPAGPDGSGG